MDSVGQRVRILRETRGMSQSELSRRVNVTPQAIQSLESDSNPNRKTKHVVSIATALDFDPRYLDPSMPVEQFRKKVYTPDATVAERQSQHDRFGVSDDDDLIDLAIEQARKNIALRLKLSGEEISGQQYLQRLSDELRRLTMSER